MIRYLGGELSSPEEARFLEELEGDAGLRKELEDFRKLWDASGQMEQPASYDLDAEWDAVKDLLPGYDSGSGSEAGTGPGRSVFRAVYRIAAVIVVGLLLGLGGFYAVRMSSTTLVLAGNEKVEHLLPDGSHIWLNHDSKLRYKTAFDGSHRWVKLKGEAFFEVERDTLRPFVIEAGEAMVEVLGTSFNVNAYSDNPQVEITVESGVVALSSRNDQEEQIVLKAGNSGTYVPGRGELILLPNSDPNTYSWKSGYILFSNSKLSEVARVLEEVYRVDIHIPDAGLASCTLTSSFSDQDLESVLEVLSATLDLEVKREEGRIVLLGEGCEE